MLISVIVMYLCLNDARCCARDCTALHNIDFTLNNDEMFDNWLTEHPEPSVFGISIESGPCVCVCLTQ